MVPKFYNENFHLNVMWRGQVFGQTIVNLNDPNRFIFQVSVYDYFGIDFATSCHQIDTL